MTVDGLVVLTRMRCLAFFLLPVESVLTVEVLVPAAGVGDVVPDVVQLLLRFFRRDALRLGVFAFGDQHHLGFAGRLRFDLEQVADSGDVLQKRNPVEPRTISRFSRPPITNRFRAVETMTSVVTVFPSWMRGAPVDW